MSACADGPGEIQVDHSEAVRGARGGIVSAEPRAALIGLEAMGRGGSASDAVVAAFFALAVTYPSNVGLGGGGACVAYDGPRDQIRALEFLPDRTADGRFSVPAVARGMAALHARFGRLPWSQLIAPAEELARFGHPIARALAQEIRPAALALGNDPAAAALLLRSADGRPKAEGDGLVQLNLAGVLGQLRVQGIAALYGGQAGHLLVDDVTVLGGQLDIADLRAEVPRWQEPVTLDYSNFKIYLPRFDDAVPDLAVALDQQLNGELSGVRVQGRFAPGEAIVLASDDRGSAVSCSFTMGDRFGAARLAPNSGIFLATPAAAEARHLAPVLAINRNTKQSYLAIASSGGPAAAEATLTGATALLRDGLSIDQAAASSSPAGQDQDAARLQVIWCPEGARSEPTSCRYRAAANGHGLALGLE